MIGFVWIRSMGILLVSTEYAGYEYSDEGEGHG
jgi:hypothetical protein